MSRLQFRATGTTTILNNDRFMQSPFPSTMHTAREAELFHPVCEFRLPRVDFRGRLAPSILRVYTPAAWYKLEFAELLPLLKFKSFYNFATIFPPPRGNRASSFDKHSIKVPRRFIRSSCNLTLRIFSLRVPLGKFFTALARYAIFFSTVARLAKRNYAK